MYLGSVIILEMRFKNDIEFYSLVSRGEMYNKIIGKWSESMSDEDELTCNYLSCI